MDFSEGERTDVLYISRQHFNVLFIGKIYGDFVILGQGGYHASGNKCRRDSNDSYIHLIEYD